MYHQALISPSRWGLLRRAIGFAVVWCLATGTVFIPGVWAVDYYVDTGGDDGNAGAVGAPWKTLTHALGQVGYGDVIYVAAGTYDDPGNDEEFPLALVDGVAIIGDPADPDSRIISAPGETEVFYNNDTLLARNSTLTGFHLTHDRSVTGDLLMKFDVNSVKVNPEISNNVFAGWDSTHDHAILIQDSGSGQRRFTGLISGNTFTTLDKGIWLEVGSSGMSADFNPTISDNTFTNCDSPIFVKVGASFTGKASPEIVGNTTTGSVNDIEMRMNTYRVEGPTMAPLIHNNTFTGSSEESIFMYVSSMSLANSTETVTFSPTILNNTITDSGEEGMYFYFQYLTSANFASDMTIAGNTITNPGAAGIHLEMLSFSDGQSVLIDWTISNNTITFGEAGSFDGIEMVAITYMSANAGHLKLAATGNTITDAFNGISVEMYNWSSSQIDLGLTIAGNTITGGDAAGISFSIDYQSSFTASRADILDNVIDLNLGDGLRLGIEDFPWTDSYVQVACNTFTNNGGHGVWQINDWDAPAADYGGGDLGSLGLNTLMDNGGYDFYNDHEHDPLVAAQNNWWGTTDTGIIDANIYDFNDDGSKGEVLYSGWLDGPPTVSATASLVDTLEIDLSPPGPSYGDTIRYTATLEGTGDCGCASAIFAVPIPDNGIFIPVSLTATRGILINNAPTTLHPELKVGLGALEAGETVTITWDVIAGGGCSMTSQATLTCYQLGDLLTDDPDVGGDSDPTTVILDHLFCDGFESGDTTIWSNAVP